MSDEQRETNEPIGEEKTGVNEEEKDVAQGGEEEVSIAEIEEMEEYEEVARRLLAAQDENVCTYAEGYKPRQALYSCRTCVPNGGAGVCFGCSMNCHDGHDLVELYTKRRFKCDCGNGSFTQKCKLFEDKAAYNDRNLYNDNFLNSYCSCKRPFPDPEATTNEEMLQCIGCENWFHLSHTGISEASKADYEENEYVCKNCSEKMPFLDKVERHAHDEDVITCSIENREEGAIVSAHLIKGGWRKKLCACPKCEDLYDKVGCDWIHDPEDPIERYNELAEKKIAEEDEEKEKALNNFMQSQDKDVVINVISEVNNMKRKMTEFMERMGSNNVVVTTEHIKELFEGMKKERQEKFNRRMEELSEGKRREEDEDDRMMDGEH